MKKVIVLLFVLLGVTMGLHATMATAPAQNTGATQPPEETGESQLPNTPVPNDGGDKIGSGSGDDAGTINEADPANDKDPEADQGSAH